jgi:phosphomevalonate kinase
MDMQSDSFAKVIPQTSAFGHADSEYEQFELEREIAQTQITVLELPVFVKCALRTGKSQGELVVEAFVSCQHEHAAHFMEVTCSDQATAEHYIKAASQDVDQALFTYFLNRLEVPSQVLSIEPSKPLWILFSGKKGTGVDSVAQALKQVLCEATGKQSCLIKSFENTLKNEFCVQRKTDFEKFCSDIQLRQLCKEVYRDFLEKSKFSLEQICRRAVNFNMERSPTVVIITDFRHPAELVAMQKIVPNLFTIRVNSSESSRIKRGWTPNARHDDHITETALDEFTGFDATFQNDSDSGYAVLKWFSEDLLVCLKRHISP